MMEEATQPNTQPQFDNRRYGNNSKLEEQDGADVIASLHPSSLAAHFAVSLTAEASPQHILQNHGQSNAEESIALDDEEDSTKKSARDIALRFSSKVNNPSLGFVFGRNPQLSDVLLVDSKSVTKGKVTSISNKHFRIFLNSNQCLMIEDMSTNGTMVDGNILRGDKAPDHYRNIQPRWLLDHGNMIEVPNGDNEDSIRFIVVIPNRYNYASRYKANFEAYIAYLKQTDRMKLAQKAAAGKQNMPENLPVSSTIIYLIHLINIKQCSMYSSLLIMRYHPITNRELI